MKHDLKKYTTEQKIKLVMGVNLWTNYDLDGEIVQFVLSDGPVGLRQPKDRTDPMQTECIRSVAYPSMQMLSHTWNETLAYEMGHAIGNDCIEQNVDVVLGPGINVKRTPLNGRNFEYVSEDPLLAGTLAREYVKGVQSMNVGACLKHYCCNNAEYSRHWASMEVDERTLREIYLRNFEIACEAKPWTVMCSYNLVNGVRMSEHEKLYGVLRNEFGFDGLIMSDWDAVKNSEASLNAGCNLEMPFNPFHQKEMLEKADKLDLEKLDESAQKVIELAERCEETRKIRKKDLTIEQRREIAQKIEEEGIVLLKNEGVLPLKNQKLLVTGAPCFRYYFGGGSSNVFPELPFTPLDIALKEEGMDASYEESIWETIGHQSIVGNVKEAVRKAVKADCTIVCVGDPNTCEYEAADRQQIRLTAEEERAIHDLALVSDRIVVIVYGGSAIDMKNWIDEVDAVVWAGYAGECGHKALARVLTGKVNPSGKLTETFPLSLEDVPSVNSYVDASVMQYSEGLNVGYRYFDSFDVPVLFPFGYGLSYSSFVYQNLKVTKEGDKVKVSLEVKNTSEIAGKETVQLYVRDITKCVYRPYKELKAFQKVFVRAHEIVEVKFELDRSAFSYYSVAKDSWTINAGIFELQIGKNVKDILLAQKVEIE